MRSLACVILGSHEPQSRSLEYFVAQDWVQEIYVLASPVVLPIPQNKLTAAAATWSARHLNEALKHSACEWLMWLPSSIDFTEDSLSQIPGLLQGSADRVAVKIREHHTGFSRHEVLFMRRQSQPKFLPMPLPRLHSQDLPPALEAEDCAPWSAVAPQEMKRYEDLYQLYQRLIKRDSEALALSDNAEILNRNVPLHISRSGWYERLLVEWVHHLLDIHHNLDEALSWLQRSLTLFPESAELMYLKSSLLAMNKNFEPSLELLQKLEQRLPADSSQFRPREAGLYLPKLHQRKYLNSLQRGLRSLKQAYPISSRSNLSPNQAIEEAQQVWQSIIEPRYKTLSQLLEHDQIPGRVFQTGTLNYHYLGHYLQRWTHMPTPQRRFGLWLTQQMNSSEHWQGIRQNLSLITADAMLSVAERELIALLLEEHRAAIAQGEWVEAGYFRGMSSIMLQFLRQMYCPNGELHVYDSFEGRPVPSPEDENPILPAGYGNLSAADLRQLFLDFDVEVPDIHMTPLNQELGSHLPDRIGFAFIDGDYYQPVLDSLNAIYPRLVPGALVIIDDYISSPLKGPAKACSDFLEMCFDEIHVAQHGSLNGSAQLGYLIKGRQRY